MKKYKIFLCIFLFVFSTQVAFSADIFLGSDKVEVRVNDTFSVTAFINSLGKSVNSAEGTIAFPNDILSVESVSMSGSIFSIWVEQPSFSNNAGIISFNGGSPNPGFNGARGVVVRVTFRAKEKGVASLSFNDANVYANDGMGTDVTAARRGVTVVVGDTAVVPPLVPVQNTNVSNVPAAPLVISADMPDSEKWYARNQAVFSWNVGPSITSTQLLLGTSPNSVPTVVYTPPIGNRELTGLADGTSYLHVRFANANGWGATTHRKIKVDTTAPANLSVASRITEDDYIELSLQANDRTSGVDLYKVSFNGNLLGEMKANSSGNNPVRLVIPALPAGVQEISVRAYDRAGNFIERVVSVESPVLKSPSITVYPEVITKGEQIEVQGKTYPNGDVRIFIEPENKKALGYVVKADGDGIFVFKSDSVGATGLTSVWAVVLRGDTVESGESSRVYVRVNKSAVVRAGLTAIETLAVIIPLVLLVLVLIFVTYYGFHHFRVMRRKLIQDLDKVEDQSHKIFKVIKEDVKDSVEVFKRLSARRKISEEEKRILETLTKDVEQAEEYFKKRIEKIEKEDL